MHVQLNFRKQNRKCINSYYDQLIRIQIEIQSAFFNESKDTHYERQYLTVNVPNDMQSILLMLGHKLEFRFSIISIFVRMCYLPYLYVLLNAIK